MRSINTFRSHKKANAFKSNFQIKKSNFFETVYLIQNAFDEFVRGKVSSRQKTNKKNFEPCADSLPLVWRYLQINSMILITRKYNDKKGK